MITLESKLSDIIGARKRRVGPRVGIELEYEGFSAERFRDSGVGARNWYMDNDPSLRGGGIEFISTILLPGSVPGALEEAGTMIKASHARGTPRCGVHVHVNMSDLRMYQIWNTLVLYVLAEPTVFKQFADGRENSHFCVPMWANAVFAQTIYNDIRKLRNGVEMKGVGESRMAKARRAVQRAQGFEEFVRDGGDVVEEPVGRQLGIFQGVKYSAMNCRTLATLGTLEFRQHPATTDMGKVQAWVDFLLRLRHTAIDYKDPLDVLNEYDASGLQGVREQLGLEHPDIDHLDQEEALDVATMAAGHVPQPWQELEWEIK